MRRRIVLTNVLASVITLLLFATIVVWASATRINLTERGFARVDANRIATGCDALAATGNGITAGRLSNTALAGLVRSDESVVVRFADGTVLHLGVPRGNQHVSATSNVRGVASVTVHTAGDSFVTAVVRIGLVLALIALVAIAASAFIARRLANSLVEPVRDLALVAARLGSGNPRPARRRYGIAELDAVAEVLDVSAQRIGEQIATERQLAADVSHQLRTPLTALSMRLEEVIATDDQGVARTEATIALQQVERLSGVVDDLLAFARHTRAQTNVDVDGVLVQQLDEWRGAYQAQGRALRITGEPGLQAWVSTSGLGQVVATLLENALVHGAGSTTVRTRTTGSSVVVEVSDEGAGVPPDLARRIFDRDVSGASRSGLGLAVARALTEVEGGRLELIQASPAVFAVFLPLARDADDSTDAAAQKGSAQQGSAAQDSAAQDSAGQDSAGQDADGLTTPR